MRGEPKTESHDRATHSSSKLSRGAEAKQVTILKFSKSEETAFQHFGREMSRELVCWRTHPIWPDMCDRACSFSRQHTDFLTRLKFLYNTQRKGCRIGGRVLLSQEIASSTRFMTSSMRAFQITILGGSSMEAWA